MTINIQEETDIPFTFPYEKTAKDVICFVCDDLKFPYEAEVSLTLTDNAGIHECNRTHRQIDAPTDVLSFPMLSLERPLDFITSEADMDNFNPDTGEALLGDIIISVEKVTAQAEAYGHSVLREFAFLIVHSMLHLFGYDHMTEKEAALMEAEQRRILEKMQITR